MNALEKHLSDLAGLATFDPNAFQADELTPQEVCNLILALALIFNDLKDAIFLDIVLDEARPEDLGAKTPQAGAFNGMNHHVFRVAAGILHELFQLLKKNHNVIDHPFFKELVRGLPKEARQAWNTLTEIAVGAPAKGAFGKGLLFVRNKIGFHYDPVCLHLGYSRHFCGECRADDRAFVSRGENMAGSRFYFADAASTGYAALSQNTAELPSLILKHLRKVNVALMAIVDGFIQKRGFPYRVER